MSSVVKSRKRKVEECEDGENAEGHITKGAKWDSPNEKMVHSTDSLSLLRLVPEDWAPVVITDKQEEDCNVEVRENAVSRGTLWTGKDTSPVDKESYSKLALSCKRFPGTSSSSSSCETQTCHFIPDAACDTPRNLPLRDDVEKDILVRKCCVIDCRNSSSGSGLFYCLPSNECEKRLWADILGVEFSDASGDSIQEICSNHFVTYEDPATITQSPAKTATSPVPKAKTRKKRTCDILIAEEAEKVKQSMTTGRSKRTPKPNRHYDWAELIPLTKNDTYELEEVEPVSAATTSVLPGTSKGRKQPRDKRREKENEKPYIEVSLGMGGETEILEIEAEDYGINISLPSAPRPPPPKSKGRPHKIQDSCAQTDGSPCLSRASRGPLREVKVQCNLTGEPLTTCSSCSTIDWKSLDGLLSDIAAVIEDDELCHPSVRKTITNALSLNSTKTSYALNVLKILCGFDRDNLESVKDIVLVSGEDELEEVEIENVIHEEEAPMSGVKEIIPKVWNKTSEGKKEITLKTNEAILDDQDSLGLREATDRDDDEFKPDYSAFEEEEEDDDEDELEDDEDWDLKNKDDPGVPLPRKKKGRQKVKKEQVLKAEYRQGSSQAMDNEDDNSDSSVTAKTTPLHRRRRNEGDTRWIRKKQQCKECNEVFSTQRKYELHYSHVHLSIPPWQGNHQCDDCGRTFTQKITLNVHRMFKHGAPRPYKCNLCNYEGPTREYMKRHMKVHTGERRYVCQECGKRLKSADSFKNHMVLHTNKGRFFCHLCKKAYNHKGAFTDHMQSHRENRDYACYCGADFKVYKHVARHIRAVHLNDKRFICDICGSQYMSGFNLKNHMKKHGDLTCIPYSYQCPGCDTKFRGFHGLSAHMRVVHKTEPSKVVGEEKLEKPSITLHPTRRPVKYQYSRTSSSKESPSSVGYLRASEEPLDFDGGEDLVIAEVKNEDEIYSPCEVKIETTEEEVRESILYCEDIRKHIIQIYSCTECESVFTSESLCQAHMNEAHC